MRKLTDYAEADLIPAKDMPLLFPGTTDQAWNVMRHKGTGPAYVKVMRRIFYRRADVDAWLADNRMIRTDTPAPKLNAGRSA